MIFLCGRTGALSYVSRNGVSKLLLLGVKILPIDVFSSGITSCNLPFSKEYPGTRVLMLNQDQVPGPLGTGNAYLGRPATYAFT